MGIPFYFYTIINQHPYIVDDKVPKCSRLFLDFNSIIHNTANALLTNGIDVDTHIYEDIVKYVDSITNICPPTDLLYIAIDGVAPCAKMHQQRKRRYMTSFRNEYASQYKRDHQLPNHEWDSNQITPGTEFMKRLNTFLKEHYATNKCDFDVIISGSDEPMEGEHKFIRYIKSNPPKDGCNDVIYGLDADLIMLSLTCDTPNIYLMRESTNFQMIKSNHELGEGAKQACFKYLNIDKFRNAISEFLYDSEDLQYMKDYVFICFFLGNDFLPNLPYLKLKYNALNVLCDSYKYVHKKTASHLIVKTSESEDYRINFEFLKDFLENLGKMEDKYMQDITQEYNNCKYNTNRRPVNPFDRYMLELDNYPIKNSMTPLINPIEDNKWRLSYYHYLFPNSSSKNVKDICMNYIEGLHWNMNYYFNTTYSTNWYYRYGYSPCVIDLFNNLCILSQAEFDKIGSSVKDIKSKN